MSETKISDEQLATARAACNCFGSPEGEHAEECRFWPIYLSAIKEAQ